MAKKDPCIAMRVVWESPESFSLQGRFTLTSYIKVHGTDGLVVSGVYRYAKGNWVVTLNKDGEPVRTKWNSELGNVPKFFRSEILRFDWMYLRPQTIEEMVEHDKGKTET